MSIRAKTGHRRCQTCRLHFSICLCQQLEPLETRHRVTLILHNNEQYKTSNTGRFAIANLSRGREWIHGIPRQIGDAELEPETDSLGLLLFPDEEAELLTEKLVADQAIELFVPDGTWRQAAKIGKRVPRLRHMKRVCLPPGAPSRYNLRRCGAPQGLSTMEAIARAMGILEGESVQRELEYRFHLLVDRLLWLRGKLPKHEVLGGIQPDAHRHLIPMRDPSFKRGTLADSKYQGPLK